MEYCYCFVTYRQIFYFVTYRHILYSILWLTDTFSIMWLTDTFKNGKAGATTIYLWVIGLYTVHPVGAEHTPQTNKKKNKKKNH